MTPVKIADSLWDLAKDIVKPPQVAIVIVSEPAVCAFHHNCIAGDLAFASALRELANKIEPGEFVRPSDIVAIPKKFKQ